MNDMDVPNMSVADVAEPKIDIRYTNGHIKGKFRFKFKQHVFNWVITMLVSGCGIHGTYLHYHEADLDKTILEQQKMISESQAREAVVAASLQQTQLLLMRQSMIFPTSSVDSRDASRPRP